MTVDLAAYFQQFLENISLGDPQVPRMNRAAETISQFLADSYGVARRNIFLQGSYANGTSVEPVEGGEYDIDLVAVCVDRQTTANDALGDLENRFRADGRFRDRLKRKKPCVRLQSAEDDVGKFHVDVVPVRQTGQVQPPLEVPRRDDGWHGTAPAEYTAWCLNQGERYARTVKMMKRWRDHQQTVRTAIKSIVLQVLIADCMSQEQDDASRLASTLRTMHLELKDRAEPPDVINPVLPTENLAASWPLESFRSFVNELAEAVEWANKAMAVTDVVEAADRWRELLGDDFPLPPALQFGFQLGDYSHAQTSTDMGWREVTDDRYAVRVTASQQRGKRALRT